MTDLSGVVGLGIAFTAGVVSFASPCCLPLVPAYVSYIVGATGEGTTGRRPAATHGIAFVLGFSLVFISIWAAIGALGVFLDRRVLNMVGGALLVVLGLQVAGLINIRALWRDTRVMPSMSRTTGGGLALAGASGGTVVASGSRPGYGRSFAFGLLFAAGWSPCIGPILGGILGLATVSASVAAGTTLLIAYAAGLAVPFMGAALGASALSRRLGWVGRHHVAVNAVTGLLLAVLGVLMLTNTLGQLAKFTSPLGL
jgi:cytochrome c-type biogenesis protein